MFTAPLVMVAFPGGVCSSNRAESERLGGGWGLLAMALLESNEAYSCFLCLRKVLTSSTGE